MDVELVIGMLHSKIIIPLLIETIFLTEFRNLKFMQKPLRKIVGTTHC